MSDIEIKVPVLPESVSNGIIARITKKVGDVCQIGDIVAELETDKVMLEIPANHAGTVANIAKKEGDEVSQDEIIMVLSSKVAMSQSTSVEKDSQSKEADVKSEEKVLRASPSARATAEEKSVKIDEVKGSGRHGIVMKSDINQHIDSGQADNSATERVAMSRMRVTIAKRLVESKNQMAMLTTFNDVNMQPIMEIRSKYKDEFLERHGVKLGFMSFFVKAVTSAMTEYPMINASVDGTDILYHKTCHMGIAVSTEKGLVVPVIKSVENMTFSEIEKSIVMLAKKARDQKLTIDDMQNGTFTITNGGVFGSLLSTPIVNPPQSAILGMHRIEKKVVVENDEMVIRPMMYLALSYDHRLIDGSVSVGFLQKVKVLLENPSRLMLNI